MLRIIQSGNVPAGSFLTARDVEPVLSEEDLTIFAGTGPFYPWGNTVVASTVVLQDPGSGCRLHAPVSSTWHRAVLVLALQHLPSLLIEVSR